MHPPNWQQKYSETFLNEMRHLCDPLADAAHVLIATGRLHQDVTRRIYETAQMSHNMSVKNGMRPGGSGHRIILEVRLLHAMVRKYLRHHGWDTAKYDEPVNQEDMAFK